MKLREGPLTAPPRGDEAAAAGEPDGRGRGEPPAGRGRGGGQAAGDQVPEGVRVPGPRVQITVQTQPGEPRPRELPRAAECAHHREDAARGDVRLLPLK